MMAPSTQCGMRQTAAPAFGPASSTPSVGSALSMNSRQRWLYRSLVMIALLTMNLTGGVCTVGDEPRHMPLEESRIREAIEAALPLLEKSSRGSANQRKCFTCHSQALPVMALSEARLRNFEIDTNNYERQIKHTIAHLRKGKKNYADGKGQGGGVDTAGYALWTLEVGQYPADHIVDAVTHFLLASAGDSDHWQCSSNRPPSESSDFTTTYLAIRALKYYSNDKQQIAANERYKSTLKWLLSAKPETTEDKVFHLRSLSYLDAPLKLIKRFTADLINAQRIDGGWSQISGMESDPYATATVLVGLARTSQTARQQPAYANGISYLLKHQTEQGSWHVKSRSKPFQKYFETGFPHEEDQFISSTATAWATIALLLSLPPKESNLLLEIKSQK